MDLPDPLTSRYRLLARLGAGTMGAVYRAERLADGRVVAIKRLEGAGLGESQAPARFLQEARILARIRSPHVVRVLEVGESEGVPFYVMDLVEGEDLAGLLARGGAVARSEALDLLRGVAAGLRDVHAEGITHRDLKPANVVVGSQGQAILVDFGLARSDEGSSVRTRTGVIVGTPGYLAPETLQGKKPGPPADVYALGILAYRMLIGRLPFEGSSLAEVIQAQGAGISSEAWRPVPVDFRTLLKACTETRPGERPAAVAVVEALARIEKVGIGNVDDLSVSAPTVVVSKEAVRPGIHLGPLSSEPARSPKAWLFAVGLVLCCGVWGWFSEALTGRQTPPVEVEAQPDLSEVLLESLASFEVDSALDALLGDLPTEDITRFLDDLNPETATFRRKAPRRRVSWPGLGQAERDNWVAAQTWASPLTRWVEAGGWALVDDPAKRSRLFQALMRLRRLELLGRSVRWERPLLPSMAAALAPVLQVAVGSPASRQTVLEDAQQVLSSRCHSLTSEDNQPHLKVLLGTQAMICPKVLCRERPWKIRPRLMFPLAPEAEEPLWIEVFIGLADLFPALELEVGFGLAGEPVRVAIPILPRSAAADYDPGADCSWLPLPVRVRVRRDVIGFSPESLHLQTYRPLGGLIDSFGNQPDGWIHVIGVGTRRTPFAK